MIATFANSNNMNKIIIIVVIIQLIIKTDIIKLKTISVLCFKPTIRNIGKKIEWLKLIPVRSRL